MYIGVLLGFITTGLLMPKFLNRAEVGLVNVLMVLNSMLTSLAMLGTGSVLIRMFPYFRQDEKKHNGILSLVFIINIIGLAVVLSLLFIFKDYIMVSKEDKANLLQNNFYLLPILIFFTLIFYTLDIYNRMLYDTISGVVFREWGVRIMNLVLLVVYALEYIEFQSFMLLYALAYCSPSIMLMILLIKRKQLYLSLPSKEFLQPLKKRIMSVAFWGIVTTLSGVAVMNIDKYMVNSYIGLQDTGIYSISFYFASIILLPSKALAKISSVFISESWKKNDTKTLASIYSKSTVNQLLIAVYLFVGIWANIHNVFKILPGYSSGLYVVLFLGLANIIEMGGGVSVNIIAMSRNYRVHSYITMFLVGIVILTNILLIPQYKITGAALASLVSVFLTFLLRYTYIRRKYKFQPYSKKHIYIILTGLLILAITHLIPKIDNLYIDLLMRGSIITILFGVISYKAQISEDANRIANKFLEKIKR